MVSSGLDGKNVLFVGGPYEALPAIGRAVALGVRPMVVDGDPEAPGLKWARDRGRPWAVASTYDAGAVLEAGRPSGGWDPAGVVAVACDVGPVVSEVAASLGLPCIPVDVARLGWDKATLRTLLWAAGIYVPELPDLSSWDGIKGTWVVKPSYQGRGGRGAVLARVGSYQEWANALTIIINFHWLVRDDKVSPVVERFVDGPQVSAEAVVWDGEVVFCGLTDRDYRFRLTWPRPVEFGGWGPSRFEGTDAGASLRSTVRQVVAALGMRAGTVKLDLVLADAGPVVVECAVGRLSGGYSATHYWPLCYGVDFIGAALAVACGLDPRPWLERTREPRYCRGLYGGAMSATHNAERGRFHLFVGKTMAEAEEKERRHTGEQLLS